ncbi:acyl-CoA thioesterase [Spongisporangium articulatum]|uniref:Acyl-CoA thioesterase n=1 Tax=Spongisporangium articulatum TaxID=3362603 RepID=A0ABW8AKH2_9ACTN
MPRHRVLTPLRWSDMDVYGHVNNVQFLRIMEEARVIAFNSGGNAAAALPATGLVVARTEIEYLTPLVYRTAPIAVDLWVTRVGAADFDMAYEILDRDASGGGTGAVYARAETMLVAFDLTTQRPRRIDEKDREILAEWADSPVRWKRRRGDRGAARVAGGARSGARSVARPA